MAVKLLEKEISAGTDGSFQVVFPGELTSAIVWVFSAEENGEAHAQAIWASEKQRQFFRNVTGNVIPKVFGDDEDTAQTATETLIGRFSVDPDDGEVVFHRNGTTNDVYVMIVQGIYTPES